MNTSDLASDDLRADDQRLRVGLNLANCEVLDALGFVERGGRVIDLYGRIILAAELIRPTQAIERHLDYLSQNA